MIIKTMNMQVLEVLSKSMTIDQLINHIDCLALEMGETEAGKDEVHNDKNE